MESLQTLKLELISQKAEIENKGGVVSVANTNPSPSEITSGIKSITIPDLTSSTATCEDVILGKTFYSGDSTIKTGTKQIPDLTIANATEDDVLAGKTFYSGNDTIKTGTKEIADLSIATATEDDVIAGKTFFSGDNSLKTGTRESEAILYTKLFVNADSTGDEILYYTLPDGIKNLKSYLLYECGNKNIEFTFNSDIETIGNYAFYNCANTTFTNFSSLTNLTTIGDYAFAYMSNGPIDFTNLPTSITSIGLRCFYDSLQPNTSISLHSGISELNGYAFAVTEKTEMNQLYIPDNINVTQLPGYMFENCMFDCDFKIPANVTSLAASFGYGCSFNNITIPATCTTLGNGVFYCKKTEAASYRRLKSVTFESSTPPTFGTNTFSDQDKTNGFKIYVPDDAVNTYKAVSRLSSFINYIYPISQKV